MTSDRVYREIVAYDSLFWAVNTDVTEWYNSITFPIKQSNFRDSLFEYLGIEQERVNLPNDDIEFYQTLDVEKITGLTVLQALCEINATWGVINNTGQFKYARIRKNNKRALYPSNELHPNDELYPSDISSDIYSYGLLYPKNDLYPSENLYPGTIYEDKLTKSDYYQGSLKYEEYDTQIIKKITIREDSEDVGFSYGKDGNTYVIEGNFLLYGASNEVLENVAKRIYEYAKYITYTPAELKCKGSPWREVGDLLFVVADKRVLTIPILNRTLNGITALKDTYTAKGQETYEEIKNGSSEQIKQLKSRTNKLTRNLEETRFEITKIEKNIDENYSTTEETKSLIQQTADDINLELRKKVNEDELVTKLSLSNGVIELIGNRIVIESDKFKLDEEGNLEMSSAKIKMEGTVRKIGADYTQDDVERANRISLGIIYPTVEDFEKYDLNGDGLIDILDIIKISKLLENPELYYDIQTTIEINPLYSQSVLKTNGVSIGMNGMFSKNINSENAYMQNVFVMNQGGGYYQGATGTFTTLDGKEVTVMNGIITTIVSL